MSEPLVTISIQEYNKLKDLEYQFGFLLDKIKMHKELLQNPTADPLGPDFVKMKVWATIKKKDYDLFINNLLGVEELLIDNGE